MIILSGTILCIFLGREAGIYICASQERNVRDWKYAFPLSKFDLILDEAGQAAAGRPTGTTATSWLKYRPSQAGSNRPSSFLTLIIIRITELVLR